MKRKLTALLCLVLSVLLLMPGCVKKTDPGQDPGTDPGETPSQEEPKKEETSKDPISIETEAGAVLVGIVRKDADGWYLQTEQPVNVTLTALLDRPEVFDNQTGIRMFETDAYSLGNFRDCTVTVQGMLQNYRGAGTLYLYPCLIEVGKTVDVGRAMPELTYPEATISGDYDPSIPLPEKMQPVIRNGKYVYNFYSLSRNTLEQMGNDYTAFYMDFVDAFLSYKTSCPCPEKFYADLFTSIMFYEFPLFYADGEYDMLTGYDSQTKTIHWSYTKTKAEHDRMISDFASAANSILAAVDVSASDALRAQQLYHAFCPLMTYDYATLENGAYRNPYHAYVDHRGVCITFAGALSQLFTRIGVQSTLVSGSTNTGEGHAWNMITIDGKNYFCDATYELTFKEGTAYAYYGMTLDQRLADGSIAPDSISVGGACFHTLQDGEISATPLQVQ